MLSTLLAISSTAGLWLGIIGIILGIVAFFWQPVWMSVIGIVLGIIGCFAPDQLWLNIAAIAVSVIALIVYFVKKDKE